MEILDDLGPLRKAESENVLGNVQGGSNVLRGVVDAPASSIGTNIVDPKHAMRVTA